MLKREENIRRGEESLQAMQKKLDELEKDLTIPFVTSLKIGAGLLHSE